MRTRPKQFGNSWPEFVMMTEREKQTLLNELQQEGRLKEYYAEHNRVRIVPSADEVSLMDESLAWPMQYLRDDRELALIVTGWCDGVLRRNETAMPELVAQGLGAIARGLTRDRVQVR